MSVYVCGGRARGRGELKLVLNYDFVTFEGISQR